MLAFRNYLRFLIPCAALYCAALFLPVFQFAEGDSTFIVGFVCLLFGWGYAAWFANPLLFGAHVFLLLNRPGVAAVLSLAALGVALTTLQITEVPKNESGTKTAVTGYRLGFYLWLASIVFTLASSALVLFRRSSLTSPPKLVRE